MNDNLAYKEEPRYEIIGGDVVMMAPASTNHNRVCYNISLLFGAYLKGRRCEYFPDGEGLFLDDGQEEYQPDGMVVCDPEKIQNRGIVGAPDFVLEVLSPGTAWYDRGRKKEAYARHGVREYWIVNPKDCSVEQYALEEGQYVLRNVYTYLTGEELSDLGEAERNRVRTEFQSVLFPDLTVRLEDVFYGVARRRQDGEPRL